MLSLDKTKDVEGLEKHLLGDQKCSAVLEAGWPDSCAYLSGRGTSEGGHQRKWRSGRGYHQQCPGISEYSAERSPI